jgi:flavin reductase (DIM6/NTAB) family NADH-FMN oxidoreductase RutF
LRAATQSHGNILARKAFTVSIASEDYVKEADYAGLVSGRDVDKFAAAGLTPVKGEHIDAPYVAEYPMALECSLLHVVEIGLHTLFVGEIMDVKADADVFNDDGKIDITKVRPLLWAPDGGGYYGVGDYLGQAFKIGNEIKSEE